MLKYKPGLTLTEKEKMFCAEYIVDMDAAQAAMRAEYSEDCAADTASRLLQNADALAYISQLQENKALLARININDVLLELAKIAFAEVKDILDEDSFDEAPKKYAEKTPEGGAKPETPKRELYPGEKPMMEILRRQRDATRAKASQCTPATTCKQIYMDTASGRQTIVQFSLTAKIAALKILARYLGLMPRAEKMEMPKPNIIFPRMEYVPNRSNSAL